MDTPTPTSAISAVFNAIDRDAPFNPPADFLVQLRTALASDFPDMTSDQYKQLGELISMAQLVVLAPTTDLKALFTYIKDTPATIPDKINADKFLQSLVRLSITQRSFVESNARA